MSDLTSPGLSSQGLHSSTINSSPALTMNKSSGDVNKASNENKAKPDEATDDDDSYDPNKDPKGQPLKNDHDLESSDDAILSERDEESSDGLIGNVRTPPKLSDAEKVRSKLLSSTARGDRKRKMSSVTSSTKSSSISFHQRMIELRKDKVQESNSDFPFVKGDPKQYAKGVMKCIACAKEVFYVKNSTLQNHISSSTHKANVKKYVTEVIPLKNSLRSFVTEKEKEQRRQGIGSKSSIDKQETRMQLCYSLLSDGLSFKFLESKNPAGLASFLRYRADVDVSYRMIRDMIPEVLNHEMKFISEEVAKASFISVIFDATPDRGEAFAVVLRYTDELFEVHHRCITLTFYESSFDAEALGRPMYLLLLLLNIILCNL